MTSAIFVIVFVAFAARLVMSAAAIGNAVLAAFVALLAVAAYVAAVLILRWSPGALPLWVLCPLMLALGYAVPAFLTDPRVRALALFAGVLTAAFVAHVWRTTPFLPIYLAPHSWFGVGIAAFLVLKARFFEDVLSTD